MRRLLTSSAIALALGAAGCASASKDAAAPEAPSAGEAAPTAAASPPMDAPQPAPQFPFSEDDEEPGGALARAEAELDAALRGRRELAKPPVGAETSPPKKAEEPSKEGPLSEADSCTTACRALASMRRSAERICDHAGGGATPGRCDDARSRVTKAESRVRERCASCAAAG